MRLLMYLINLLFLYSCSDYNVIYEKNNKLNTIWDYDDVQEFKFLATDSIKSNEIILQLQHEVDFDFSNIYTKIETTFPDQNKIENIISLDISDGKGKWLGDCIGNTCKVNISLSENKKFLTGEYTIKISQHSRVEKLSGIKGIGLIIRQYK